MAPVEVIAEPRRKRRPRAEAATDKASSRPERELVLDGLLAPGLRVRVWAAAQPLTPARV